MRFLAEDRIASEIAEIIKSGFNYNNSIGSRPFSIELDIDQGEWVSIDGLIDFTVGYEESVNHAYISFASAYIDEIKVFNIDGDETKCEYNVRKIEEYIENYLTE